MRKSPKPRLPFCWVCSRKLQGNFHRVAIVDGPEKIVHASCASEEGLELKTMNDERVTQVECNKDACQFCGNTMLDIFDVDENDFELECGNCFVGRSHTVGRSVFSSRAWRYVR